MTRMYRSYRDIPVEVLDDLFRYDAETGELFWRWRDEKFFGTGPHGGAWEAKRWNARYAYKLANGAGVYGYYSVSIFKLRVPVHRVIWAIVHRAWPNGLLDHIDGDRKNNRISNLREVGFAENTRNAGLSRTNTSGHIGVSRQRQRNGRLRWVAYIRENFRQRHIGVFDTFEEACAARQRESERLGFHPNHGARKSYQSPDDCADLHGAGGGEFVVHHVEHKA